MSLASTAPTTLPARAPARAPARPTDRPAFDGDDDVRPQALLVEVGGTKYAIPVVHTREVIRAPRITRVPGAPGESFGVVNVRGSVVTVLDLAAILHGSRAVTGSSVVLIENGARFVGLAVDAVCDVRQMEVRADGTAFIPDAVTLDATALCARYMIPAEEM